MEIIQGESKDFSVGPAGTDLTPLVGETRITFSTEGKATASNLAADTVLKVDNKIKSILYGRNLGAGIRIHNKRTGEWMLATAINGNTLTITRGAVDPGGAATTAADTKTGDSIFVVPVDNLPVSATVDGTNNELATVRVRPNDTMNVPPSIYDVQVTMQDAATNPDERVVFDSRREDSKKIDPITVIEDPNSFAVN